MGGLLGGWFTRVKEHPWVTGARVALLAAVLGAAAEAVVSGARSHALAAVRLVVLGWHPFPILAWGVVGPLCALGVLRAWEWFRASRERPDESQGVRWRCGWAGRRVVTLEPVCPNPNCGQGLTMTEAGGRYGSDAVLVCAAPGCGFRWRYEDTPAVVLADARRDLEGQAAGRPPLPPKPRRSRLPGR